MERKNNKQTFITLCVILVIGIGYIYQMAPSPVLGQLKDRYGIGNEALLNLAVSIVHPLTIGASLYGGVLLRRMGLYRMFIWTQVLLAAGILMNLAAGDYLVFLAGRVVYSAGFGLGIPFIGAAITSWYSGNARERMNTLNGMFPFIGTLISFSCLTPLSRQLGSLSHAFAIWAVPLVLLLLFWLTVVRRQDLPAGQDGDRAQEPAFPQERGVYSYLWGKQGIRLLCIIFMMDFFCYSYMVVILPTYLAEAAEMEASAAGLLAAAAFPAIGILGSMAGGILMSVTGRRKPILAAGQALKLAGVLVLTLCLEHSLIMGIAGIIVFAVGNGMWMPVMYTMPMEMDGMDDSRVGAAFAFMSSCGFLMGFISPILGGGLTNTIMAMAPHKDLVLRHVFGLKWSLFLFGFTNIEALVCALRIEETGK